VEEGKEEGDEEDEGDEGKGDEGDEGREEGVGGTLPVPPGSNYIVHS